MILAPKGVLGSRVLEGFLRMAQGRNARHELYERPGHFQHPDGWGAVIEQDGVLSRVRGLEACWEDPAFPALGDRRIVLLHARRASCGGVQMENVHPFERVDDGESWFFSHNGTIRDPLPRSPRAEGATDSEAYFDRLLEAIRTQDPLGEAEDVVASFRDYTSLNAFLVSEREAWVVSAWRGHEQYYTLRECDTREGPVFSSEVIRELGGDWRPLASGEILRIERGTGRIARRRVTLR